MANEKVCVFCGEKLASMCFPHIAKTAADMSFFILRLWKSMNIWPICSNRIKQSNTKRKGPDLLPSGNP